MKAAAYIRKAVRGARDLKVKTEQRIPWPGEYTFNQLRNSVHTMGLTKAEQYEVLMKENEEEAEDAKIAAAKETAKNKGKVK